MDGGEKAIQKVLKKNKHYKANRMMENITFQKSDDLKYKKFLEKIKKIKKRGCIFLNAVL